MKKLIIGLGISGKAAAAFLLKQGHTIIGVDRKAEELRKDPSLAGVEVLSDGADLSLEGIEQVIVSPGIPPEHPLVQKVKKEGIEIIGEIELAFRHLTNICVGVTGSNGKTTTVLLATHVLNSAGKKARALGNVGASLTGYLMEVDAEEILIVELSSFQIDTLQMRCLDLALILNITPNHLDRYPSMETYAASKISIREKLKPGGQFLVSRQVVEYSGAVGGEVFDLAPFSKEGYNRSVPEQNVSAAFAICRRFGITKEIFERGLSTFKTPPHRIEWVAEIEGVSYYNDSKSTSIDSVMHAVNFLQGPLILIAGGTDKGAAYEPWIACFKGKVRELICYGKAAARMESELGSAIPLRRVTTLEEAVELAQEKAREREIVLLSPGCSSYDQFRGFEHRGEEFKRLVKGRKK